MRQIDVIAAKIGRGPTVRNDIIKPNIYLIVELQYFFVIKFVQTGA
jgi:hypothetical protein